MGQDETWHAGLGLVHIVLDGDTVTPPLKNGGTDPQFSAHVRCGKTAGWIKMPLGMEVCFGPGDIVLDGVGTQLPPPKKGGHSPLIFGSCLLWPSGRWINTPLVRSIGPGTLC